MYQIDARSEALFKLYCARREGEKRVFVLFAQLLHLAEKLRCK